MDAVDGTASKSQDYNIQRQWYTLTLNDRKIFHRIELATQKLLSLPCY